jgi:nitrile hydratase beta subunit
VNGIHDMGGMDGMGPIEHETNEPVFHAPWEGRIYALTRVLRAGGGRSNLDASRHAIELLPAADYLRMSYYERWVARMLAQLVSMGVATAAEVESGRPAPGSVTATPALTAVMIPEMIARRNSARRNVPATPRFKAGERVRARNINPAGHTRLPRYARGKTGIIVRDHGVFVFPDTNAHFLGEKPQHLYSVRFTGRELWGERASARDFIHLDMWDDYLDRV